MNNKKLFYHPESDSFLEVSEEEFNKMEKEGYDGCLEDVTGINEYITLFKQRQAEEERKKEFEYPHG